MSIFDLTPTPLLAAPLSSCNVEQITLCADALNYNSPETNRFVSIPVVELSYLARHIAQRGQGLGEILLMRALRYVAEAADWIGEEDADDDLEI